MKEKERPSDPILIVDDEAEAIMGCRFMLETAGLNNIIPCSNSTDVMDIIKTKEISLVLLDLSMPEVTGKELLLEINRDFPDTPVIIITGTNNLETAIDCMKNGAFDYLVKPFEESRFVSSVKKAVEMRELKKEYTSFKDRIFSNKIENPEAFSEVITENSQMHTIFKYCETIAKTLRPVLITGDTGTGKELIAHALHSLSRSEGEFIAVNIAGLDDTLFSDTIFGHTKGAFTGAEKQRKGMIEKASGGTLFLDEIGDLNLNSQVKLLRLLEQSEYQKLGSDATLPLEARVIVATNKRIDELRSDPNFRSDLYYRLRTHHINIPPLSERMDDIPILVDFFVEKSAKALNIKKPYIPREVYTLLSTYSFPGNIRELESIIFEAVSRNMSGILSSRPIQEYIETQSGTRSETVNKDSQRDNPFSGFTELPRLDETHKLLITEALRRAGWNQSVAAKIIGISRSGLNKAIKRYGIKIEKTR